MKAFLRAILAASALMAGIPTLAADDGGTIYGSGRDSFSLATGSPGELGLLKTLAEAFARQADARMVWIKAGTGQSLNLLRDKKVDMVMVHAPAQVDKAIADGWAAKKTLIGSNEFYLVGPAADPAGIAKAGGASEAYRKIAAAGSPFVSRGDNSGTHQKEMQIWKTAGVEPQGAWYIVTKDFMTASLKRANAEGAYFMSDSSTWIMEKGVSPNLTILLRGDRVLVNTYHAIVAPPGATAGRDTAERFIAFVASPEGQRIIADFGRERFGEGLYNDASYARQFD
ncbi:MAG: substrate-binding domain-containing protein [Azonexus sp.]|nr:substrate-binding domain-containing protein [Betaproteobacteria bacterium]MBP6037128.1 substrate-binding domain-containing protein [Azonexus sp.]MBP6907671.1 substrate-binding domain-containing protein [Azonexus sp.]